MRNFDTDDMDGAEIAGEILSRNSVTFKANDYRWNDQNAWPFWMPLIPYPFLETDQLRGGLGLLGWPILPGEAKEIAVSLPDDAPIRVINSKMTCYERYGAVVADYAAGVPQTLLTGTIAITAGSTTVAGTGTKFMKELTVGQGIAWRTGGVDYFGTVNEIDSDTSLILETAAEAAAAPGSNYSRMYLRWFNPIFPQQKSDLSDLTSVALSQTSAPGTISIAASSGSVTGTSTLMATAPNTLAVGDILEYPLDGEANGTGGFTNGVSVLARVATVSGANDGAAVITVAPVQATAVTTKKYTRVAAVGASTITLNATTGVVTAAAAAFTSAMVGKTIFYTVAGVIYNAVITSFTSTTVVGVAVTSSLVAAPALTSWALSISTVINPSLPLVTTQNRFIPLTQYLKSSFYLPSLRGRYLYGDFQYKSDGGTEAAPITLGALQGVNDGMGMLRTETLLPLNGVAIFRITNTYSKTLLVNGSIFGYKIALSEDGGA